MSNMDNITKFSGKVVLGIDYGKKVTGTALFCPNRDPFPVPATGIPYASDQQLENELRAIIDDEAVEVVVLGLPLHADGNESDMSTTVRAFGAQIKASLKIEVHYQDESLTSYEAKQRMQNSPQYNFKIQWDKVDSLAAAIILEDFFGIK